MSDWFFISRGKDDDDYNDADNHNIFFHEISRSFAATAPTYQNENISKIFLLYNTHRMTAKVSTTAAAKKIIKTRYGRIIIRKRNKHLFSLYLVI